MRKSILITCGVLFALGFVLGFYFRDINLTGNTIIEENYTWTKAICNGNKCIDIVVYCEQGNVVKVEPISDVKEFDANWSGNLLNNSKLC